MRDGILGPNTRCSMYYVPLSFPKLITLACLRCREGHDSVESLKDAYKSEIENLRRQAATPATPEPSRTAVSTPYSPTKTQPPTSAPSLSLPIKAAGSSAIKPLSSFLNIEKILGLPPKEIETLWRLRHAHNPNSICACIPLETYERIASVARTSPQFILPLPRQKTELPSGEDSAELDPAVAAPGADIHFLQWAFHPPASAAMADGQRLSSPKTTKAAEERTANNHTSTIIFTHLAAYKLHGSFAEPHTTVTHYLDLADEKGLVLMHGQVMPDRGVSTAEASWLVSCVQRFYDFGGQANGRKGELLRMFTRGDIDGFKIEELMEEAERI